MLVLSRKTGESITIDEGIVVTVLEIRGDSLKLGIDAPAYVPIWRTEVLEDIKEQNRLAASKDNDNDVLRIGELLSGKKHEKQ